MHDGVHLALKTTLVAVLTVLSATWTGASAVGGLFAQTDPLTAWVPGVATRLGLAALVWRLVVDTRSAERTDRRYESLIDELHEENARLRARLAELEADGH